MIDFPDTVKVGGHDYKLLIPYDFRERSDLNGQCDSARCELRISTSDGDGPRSDSAVAVIVLHELIHACDFASGLRALCGGEDQKEQIIEMVANGLYQVFKDNPKLLSLFK